MGDDVGLRCTLLCGYAQDSITPRLSYMKVPFIGGFWNLWCQEWSSVIVGVLDSTVWPMIIFGTMPWTGARVKSEHCGPFGYALMGSSL